MKNIIIMIIAMFIIPVKSYAWFDKWQTEDYILQTGFIGLMIIDWKQTNWISDNPRTIKYIKPYFYNGKEIGKDIQYRSHKEANPILGEYPSKKKIAAYNLSCIILHTGISYILPKPFRTSFQAFFVGMEIYATTDNYYSGVKIKF